jgi:hypothetical protein
VGQLALIDIPSAKYPVYLAEVDWLGAGNRTRTTIESREITAAMSPASSQEPLGFRGLQVKHLVQPLEGASNVLDKAARQRKRDRSRKAADTRRTRLTMGQSKRIGFYWEQMFEAQVVSSPR